MSFGAYSRCCTFHLSLFSFWLNLCDYFSVFLSNLLSVVFRFFYWYKLHSKYVYRYMYEIYCEMFSVERSNMKTKFWTLIHQRQRQREKEGSGANYVCALCNRCNNWWEKPHHRTLQLAQYRQRLNVNAILFHLLFSLPFILDREWYPFSRCVIVWNATPLYGIILYLSNLQINVCYACALCVFKIRLNIMWSYGIWYVYRTI